MARSWHTIWRENGLSIVLAAMFLVFITGQTLTGWSVLNAENRSHGQPALTLRAYLHSGAFGEAVFENWESEFLQMGVYVVLTAYLFQKGSSESKDPHQAGENDADPRARGEDPRAPAPVRRGGWRLALYSHSLSLALFSLFAVSFAGHAVWGLRAANEEALRHGQSAETLAGYVTSATFWFESLQNWQSEFLAIFSLVVLSIWLREKGSPESKPVAAPHDATGK